MYGTVYCGILGSSVLAHGLTCLVGLISNCSTTPIGLNQEIDSITSTVGRDVSILTSREALHAERCDDTTKCPHYGIEALTTLV